ncbi:MAG: hypothetical protein Q7K55_04835 [Candidatus Levybacteria bacterium]|nr:hypothetical protein [Candidatus Levybacteria bacterium]
MLATLKDFDPVKFLDIDASTLSQKDLEEMRIFLNSKIGEYMLLKFSSLLTDRQFEQAVDSKEKIHETLRTFIPNLDQRIFQEIENFKKNYQTIK